MSDVSGEAHEAAESGFAWMKQMSAVILVVLAIYGLVRLPIDQTHAQTGGQSASFGDRVAMVVDKAACSVSSDAEAGAAAGDCPIWGIVAVVAAVVVVGYAAYLVTQGGDETESVDKINEALGGGGDEKDEKEGTEKSTSGFVVNPPGIYWDDGTMTRFDLPGALSGCSPAPCSGAAHRSVPLAMDRFVSQDLQQSIQLLPVFTEVPGPPAGDGMLLGNLDFEVQTMIRFDGALPTSADHVVWSTAHERQILLGTTPNEAFDIDIELDSVDLLFDENDGAATYAIALVEVTPGGAEFVLWDWYVTVRPDELPEYEPLENGWSATVGSDSFTMTGAVHTVSVNVGADGFGDYRIRTYTELVAH